MYGRPPARKKARASQVRKMPAPVAGWISNRALAVPNGQDGKAVQGAAVLDNYFPRATSVMLRRGSRRHCTLGDGSLAVDALFSYNTGAVRKLFGATETTIYDITDVEFAHDAILGTQDGFAIGDTEGNAFGWTSTQFLGVMGAFTSGDWSVVQFAATGAIFLIGVNGADDGFIYDGEAFYPYVEGGIETIDFTGETGAFTIGDVVTGGTSGASATIWRIESDGSSGTLYVHGVTGGPFQDGEALTDAGGGAATVSGENLPYLLGPTFPNGLTTADMSFVWVYKNRLYFAQKDTLDAWYLEVDNVGGEATKFPMAGIFALGGTLLFGNRWSLSSGGEGGLSEQNAFVSSEGEVAVFQGFSPSDTATWSQVGVYRVGKPLGKNAFVRGAGDLAIATSIGLVPLSKAIELDLTALTTASISYPIADAWGTAIDQRGLSSWVGEIWPEQKLSIFVPPVGLSGLPPTAFVANTETGAWGRITGWDIKCMEVFEGRLFFGSANGGVFLANETGLDDGIPYTGTVIPLFDDYGAPAARKMPRVGRYITRAAAKVSPHISWQGDFDESLPSAPDATPIEVASVWGQAIWGQSQWVERAPRILNDAWQSVGGSGYTGALAYQVTSGEVTPLDDEIISAEVLYEIAGSIS